MANETRFTDQITEVLVASNANVRFTDQVTEVLVASNANVRFTAQFVEVLVPFVVLELLEANITTSVTVSANLALPPLKADITTSATLTADLKRVRTLSTDIITSVLVGAAANTFLRDVSQSLVLVSDATAFNEHTGNTIGVSQSVALNFINTYLADNPLTLTQNAVVEKTKDRFVLTELDLLQQNLILKRVLPVVAASNVMLLSDVALGSREAKNVLNLTQLAEGIIFFLPGIATSVFALTQQVDLDIEKLVSASNILILSQNAVANHDSLQSASSILTFNQLALSSIVGLDCLVILQTPVSSIVLPCPLFGDGENISSTMSLRRSMNGATRTYIKTNNRRRLTYTFRILNRAKSLEFIDFVKKHNSDKIKLTNWKGEVWDVSFLTNPFDFVHTGRSAPCGDRVDINIEFEGVRLY